MKGKASHWRILAGAWLALAVFCVVFPFAALAKEEDKKIVFPELITAYTSELPETEKLPLDQLVHEALKANREELEAGKIELEPEKLALTERATINRVLKSEGYYSAEITYQIADGAITYTITLNRRYHISSVKYEIPPAIHAPDMTALKLKKGDPLRAQDVIDTVGDLQKAIEKKNCLFEARVEYSARVFHDAAEAELVFTAVESEQVTFGTLSIKGMEKVKEKYIANRMAFKEGGCFKRSEVDKSRITLLQTGLFSNVDTTLERETGTDRVRVHLQVSERKHRTITAGAGFSSDQGPNLSTGWEHRNFFGGAEKFDAEAKVSQEYNGIETRLTLPDFMRREQALELRAEIVQEKPDAYDSSRIVLGARVSRKISPKLKAYVGTEFKVSEVTDVNGEETFALLSFPSGLEMDRRDSPLDPKKGFLASVEVQPFFNTLDTNVNFLKTTVAGSGYLTFDKMFWSPTLALRSAFGTMQGVDTDSVPADERYYSGGAGSVRGYAYQLLGPLNGDEPIGGRSLFEISAETRLRFSEDWGGVFFLDGGNAFDDYIPKYNDGLQWAAGVGVRYYTDFAPIRFDIAVPLDRRDVDDAFQFYISIGQAF